MFGPQTTLSAQALADLHDRMCEIASRRNVVISAETVHEAPSVNCSINIMDLIERSMIKVGLNLSACQAVLGMMLQLWPT